VLVDSEYDIVHVSQSAGRFLQYGAGEHSRNLLRVVHLSLRLELRAALYQCAQSGTSVTVPPMAVEVNGLVETVTLSVTPGQNLNDKFYVIVFAAHVGNDAADPNPVARVLPDPASHQLERELERLKNHLRDNIEQHEASVEELKASNEELQAMNEELRSATEELETGREELQSINEELTTVNQELKSKVDELGHANSDMHNLMDATAIATIFLDRQLCITRYTPSAVALFNLIPSDLGRPLSDLSSQLDYPGLNDDASRVLERLVPIEREVSQGDSAWYLSRLLPYRTMDDRIAGVVLSFVNITARKLAEQALQFSDERMRLLLDNAHEYAIFATDTTRSVTIWNPGAQRLLGYSGGEMLGQPADVIFTPEDRAAGVPAQEAHIALTEGRAGDNRFHQRKDGSRFWASGALMPMHDAAGNVAGFVRILRDQTAERASQLAQERAQEELTQALLQAEKARKDLEKADAAKDHFIAVLSHELRNPLASIASAAELMASPTFEGERRDETVKILRRQTLNMKLLMDDLLDTSRLTLGQFTLHPQPTALAAVLQNAVDATRPLFSAADHTLTVNLPPQQITVNADPLRLTQVVVNLLGNAAKYTPPHGTISLACELRQKEVCIIVKDSGTGMEEADIERMFEMFTQGSNAGDSRGGLGIGLALARSIMDMHGGRITASSAGVGQGSEFRVVLPLVAPPTRSTPQGGVERRSLVPRPAGQTIVLADDNQDGAWTLAALMGAAGHTVHVAHNGEQALKLIEQYRPTVAVLDIGMPILDGYEVAIRLRELPWGQDVTLIAATGWGQDSDQQRAAQAGFFAHLTKPVDLAHLYRLIDNAGTSRNT
jgi:two-component system CheB/CheR fusion protein